MQKFMSNAVKMFAAATASVVIVAIVTGVTGMPIIGVVVGMYAGMVAYTQN